MKRSWLKFSWNRRSPGLAKAVLCADRSQIVGKLSTRPVSSISVGFDAGRWRSTRVNSHWSGVLAGDDWGLGARHCG